ncbi:MAG: response regulator transcription factor [Eubacteriales bacterium]|nr:response regulator transcription factor [Eubacteriales bacterium]MCI7778441.1 response regulator transcription factor [Clostridiales bacterium]MDD6018243.1 response regulator transcription factor [Clostridiales bacterium]MDD7489112.1 response regulator transcription factor [Clostridiales bacterium]MDD7522930.1 response regulator transcription factor [Clostridiales bacterium]
MFKILIAEDDKELCQLFRRVLTMNGYQPICVSDGKQALDVLDKEYIDLIISDIMMPNMDGYELISTLRESGITIPVLIITAKDSFYDMQRGFSSGTDDYMVKPINVNEMVLRVGALLRRAKMISDRRQVIGNTVLEYDSMTVSYNGKSMVIPQKEFMLLYKLTSYPGRIFTRQQLMDDIWGLDSETEPRTVDVHINRLRERFRDNEDFEIVTIRGLGYKAVKHHA